MKATLVLEDIFSRSLRNIAMKELQTKEKGHNGTYMA